MDILIIRLWDERKRSIENAPATVNRLCDATDGDGEHRRGIHF